MTCRSHCRVWVIVGRMTVVACGHCDEVFADWTSEPGDAERAADSQTAHQQHKAYKRPFPCQRPSKWLPAPVGAAPSPRRLSRPA
jgi:hypothetical protein